MNVTFDADAETAVLAACLSSSVARDSAALLIRGNDFQDPAHEMIWDAIMRAHRGGEIVDPVGIAAKVGGDRRAASLMPEIVTALAVPENVAHYATIVRSWAVRRGLSSLGLKLQEVAYDQGRDASASLSRAIQILTEMRDASAGDSATSRTLAELLATEDDAPDWLVPGLIERKDRLMLTGAEGLGKSVLLRQFAILSAAGVHPFTFEPAAPIRALIVDAENTERQVRARARGLVALARRQGEDPTERVSVACTRRLDLTSDRDLASLHREMDRTRPDVVVIGPLYRLTPRALQTDDEATPVLAALDTLRDRGAALLIEAHAGHAIGRGGTRDMRPRGSSALLGWPEFGFGMARLDGEMGVDVCEFAAWRGQRVERDWPMHLRKTRDYGTWVPADMHAGMHR